MNDCQQRIEDLESEVRELKEKIVKLNKSIRCLKTVIVTAIRACNQIIATAEQVMTPHKPRGTWTYAKGNRDAARFILQFLHLNCE